ncbi:MAG TPA: hypothetical protein VL346_06605 [Acidobacteriaceae bacterium]|jgi:hypothetical protein|nr:hypothetical protein [Acidobacteriaceae bacterium]
MNLALFLLQQQPSEADIERILMGFAAIIPIFILIGMAVVIIPTWFICKKAGFTPWLSLLCFVPLGGLVLLYILAFSEWKVVPVVTAPYIPPAYPPYPPQA